MQCLERWTNKTRRRSLPTSYQYLKCKRKECVEVEKPKSNNGAKTNSCFKIKQPLYHRATNILYWVPYSHMHKASKHIQE